MDEVYRSYLEADAASRQQLLLELIHTHRYFPELIPVVAEEDIEFLTVICRALRSAYPYFFDRMLYEVADHQGMQTAATLLERCGFLDSITPLDLSQVGVRYASDDNPLAEFYRHFGPPGFISLYESKVISLRQLYLWVRAQSVSDDAPYEQFILALAEHYGHDFAKAPAVLSECFVVECDIATAQDRVYYLREHLPLLSRLLDQLGAESFCDFLTYFAAKLRCRPAHESAENLIYLEFLKYASLEHLSIADQRSLCPQFWGWLIDHTSEMADLRDFLLLPATDDRPRP